MRIPLPPYHLNCGSKISLLGELWPDEGNKDKEKLKREGHPNSRYSHKIEYASYYQLEAEQGIGRKGTLRDEHPRD